MEVLFWISIAAIAYTYLGYPLLLLVVRVLKQPTTRVHGDLLTVSMIIPAYNEEGVIGAKITNALNMAYPSDRLQVIVVSDGSTDGTNQVVEKVGGDRVLLIRCAERRGKAHALNLSVARAGGDVLVFTDANVLLEREAIEKLVRDFGDPTVGAVVGRVLLQSEGSPEPPGEGLYMRYERFLHQLESDLSSMVSVDGAMFALRRDLYSPVPEYAIVEDFVVVLRTIMRGYRIRLEPEALGFEAAAPTVREEFRRKARIIAGGYQALFALRSLLNPFRHPAIAFQLISHKLMRWLVVVFLLIMAFSNIMLLDRPAYRMLLEAQGVLYLLALAAVVVPGLRTYYAFYLPYYFCAVNLAAVVGLQRFLTGRQTALWEKASR